MDILNILKRLRDDIKLWATNNMNILNTKIDNKLDSDALPGAIDNAIAQAKESGNLKGEKGNDGISATHSWSGTTLIVTSASGSSSADLKGEAGYTPVRGTDYWTNADKSEIKSYVDDAISEALEDIVVDGSAGGSAANIDATLSVSGAAADAKVVGDALDGKLDKTGGRITGNLTVYSNACASIISVADDVGHPLIDMLEGGLATGNDGNEYEVLRIQEALSDYNVILRGITNPIQDDDAANKAYVDDAISEALEDIVVDGTGGSVTSEIIEEMIDTRIQSYIDEAILGGAW